ncbi:hypothetical protein Q7P37_008501 [Cladosporium fusiforme]
MGQFMKQNWFGRGWRLQVVVMVSCQMAFILFGYDQGVFSGIVGNEDWKTVFGNPGSALEGIIVSIYNLGAFSGCILTFLVGEKLGRRLCMWIAMIWIIVGAVLQCTSYSVAQIMVARYITGIGTGIETSTVPMYQSELCDAERRGRLVSSEPLFVGVGIVIAYYFDYGMSFVPGGVAWRVPVACQVVFAFVVIFLVFGLPESPRWLYAHGRNDEALQVLCDVWDGGPDHPKVSAQQKDILEAIELEHKQGEYKWRQILKRDEVQTGRRVMLAYGMQFMNQMGGINLVVYFVPSLLEENVGLNPNMSLLIGGAEANDDRVLWFGNIDDDALDSTELLTTAIQRKSSANNSFRQCCVLVHLDRASVNCIPWVYVPEILPLHARAKGTAIGISSNWLWNFVVVMISPSLISNLAWKAYFIFMCTNFAFIPLIYFFYPETANLTLEEVDYLFIKGGHKGAKQLWHRSQPVVISLKEDVEKNAAAMGLGEHAEEKDGEKVDTLQREGSADHIEAKRGMSE